MPSIQETHDKWVKKLLERGEPVEQPEYRKPHGTIDGYVKGVKKEAGAIFEDKNGKFGLFGDFGSIHITGIEWDNLGLCDSACWYEWGEKKTRSGGFVLDIKEEEKEVTDLRKYTTRETGLEPDTVIGFNTTIYHPCNIYGSTIGDNCVISPFVQIENAEIGNNCRIHTMVSICEFVTIEDDVFIAQGVMFTNAKYPQIPSQWAKEKEAGKIATVIKKGASIGANTTILPGVTIGEYAMIGAGSVVTKDIPGHVIAYGNPCEVKRQRRDNEIYV